MKGKAFVLLNLIVLLLVFIAGCSSKPTTPPISQNQVNQTDRQQVQLSLEQQLIEMKPGVITDTTILEKIWEQYLYDTITTLGNNQDFTSAREIDPLHIGQYSWYKYIREHGRGKLELAYPDRDLLLFPVELVLPYARAYFDLTSLEQTDLPEYYYDAQRQAFTFSFGDGSISSYRDRNPWGMELDSVTKNPDGTVTAVLLRYITYSRELIEHTHTYTLKLRVDGTMYFIDGKTQYINNNLVTITGDYRRFDQITGYAGPNNELVMVGEVKDHLILAHTPYDTKSKSSLMLVNTANLAVEKRLEIAEESEFYAVRLNGDKILVFLKGKALFISLELERIDELILPPAIVEKIDRIPQYDDFGMPDVVFGGYDVSRDGSRLVYSDEEGVKLYTIADNTEELLAETVDILDSHLIKHSYHWQPRFVDDDRKILTTMTGYECSLGHTLYNLRDGTTQTLDIITDSYSGLMGYDTGLLWVNTYIHDDQRQEGEYKTLYFDLTTEEWQEIRVPEDQQRGERRDSTTTFIGQKNAVFLTNIWERDYTQNMSYLNRLNLENFNLETEIVSVKGAGTYILGLMADGRVIFWYHFNPSERGICITE